MGRRVWPLLVALVALVACRGPDPARRPPTPSPARLVLADSRDPVHPWYRPLAHPVDPATLADLPGFEPADLSGCGAAPALRPDGRVVAVAVGWRGEPAAGQPVACNTGGGVELALFDLVDWRWLGGTGVHADYLADPTWSPDGRRLYALSSTRQRTERGGLGPADEVGRLWVVDPAGAEPPRSVALPYAVHRLLVAPDGTPYLLAYRLDPTERAFLTLDPALLVALDPLTGAERFRVELPGVKLGQRREAGPDGTLAYATYIPALTFAPDGRRAYLAWADEPRMTVVDLADVRIERTVDVEAAAADTLARLLDLVADRAEAKGNPTASASLWLSADGRTLYVGGSGTAFEPTGQPNEAREVVRTRPTFALDTATWRARRLPDAPPAGPSRDGRWLYAVETDRLRVLDAATRAEVAGVPFGGPLLQLVDAGDRLYVATATADYHGAAPYRADERLVELVAYEAGSWREVARCGGHLNLRLPLAP